MKWKKLGRIFTTNNQHEWMRTHAACPFPSHLDGDIYRIYFATRNEKNQSSLSYIDINITEPKHVLAIASKPVLSPGEPGLFDDSGVYSPQIIENADRRHLYYFAWNLGVTVPFRNSIGLAIAPLNSNEFTKYSRAPLMDRTNDDPFFLTTPWVCKEKDRWRMWYGSNQSWNKNGMDVHVVLKYAESQDGMSWECPNIICLSLKEDESAIVRPCVIKENDFYKMWYSRRIGHNKTSRLGYAESKDGIVWERRDEDVGIDVSDMAGDWDSEMMAYPCVFDHKGKRYMLYNGNHYGLTGIGIAVLE